MIKKKIEYKALNMDNGAGFARKLTLYTMDGWYLTTPVLYDYGFKALIAREIAVTRDNVTDMIIEDWKSIRGNQEDFITATSRRYDVGVGVVGDIVQQFESEKLERGTK